MSTSVVFEKRIQVVVACRSLGETKRRVYARQLLSCKESFVPSAVAVASILSADIVLQRQITRESKGIEIGYVCLWIVLSVNTKPKRVTLGRLRCFV
jgi:hypothetical protein